MTLDEALAAYRSKITADVKAGFRLDKAQAVKDKTRRELMVAKDDLREAERNERTNNNVLMV